MRKKVKSSIFKVNIFNRNISMKKVHLKKVKWKRYKKKDIWNEKQYLEKICASSSFMRLASNLTSLSRCATYDLLWSLVNVSAVAPEHLISQVFCQTSRLLDDIKVLLSDFGSKYFKKKFSALPFCFTKTFN